MDEKNPFVIDSEVNHYIKVDYQTGDWVSNEERLDVNFMMIDYETIKMGWQWFESANRTYHETWQPDIYTSIPQPDQNYKKVFSVMVLPLYIEGDKNIKHPPMLWKRSGVSEYNGFMEMGQTFFSKIKDNPGLLPVLSVLESEKMVYKSGFSAYKPKFELVKWQAKPESFVTPLEIEVKEGPGAEVNSPEDQSPLTSAPQKPALSGFPLDDEDIPF